MQSFGHDENYVRLNLLVLTAQIADADISATRSIEASGEFDLMKFISGRTWRNRGLSD